MQPVAEVEVRPSIAPLIMLETGTIETSRVAEELVELKLVHSLAMEVLDRQHNEMSRAQEAAGIAALERQQVQ